VITRIQVVDSTIDILEQRKELEKRRIWKVIANMDEDRLQEQLEKFAVERKESHLGVNKIAEMLEIDEMDVKAKRSPGVRKARESEGQIPEIDRLPRIYSIMAWPFPRHETIHPESDRRARSDGGRSSPSRCRRKFRPRLPVCSAGWRAITLRRFGGWSRARYM
jgi:hypothetical protein